MRGWLCGLYPNGRTVMAMAELQAKLTHDTPNGIKAAQAAALFVHYFVQGYSCKEVVGNWIDNFVPGPWQAEWTKPVGSSGLDSVHAAISSVIMHDKMSTILKQCIDFGGDVDTVATIALAAASLCPEEIEQDLPDSLKNGLEQGEWGGIYLKKLDERLFEKFPLKKAN